MKSDIEIARSIELKKIKQVAESVDIPRDEVENYGRYIAKIPTHLIDVALDRAMLDDYSLYVYLSDASVE